MICELLKDVLSEAYCEIKPIINTTVEQFRNRYGGDFDDLESLSDESFLRAHDGYRPARGKYETWMRFIVWHQMLESLRNQRNRNNRLNRLPPETLDFLFTPPSQFKLIDFLDELSHDARFVARLTLNSPKDIRLSIAQRSKTPSPAMVQAAIAEFLIELGWDSSRIQQSFAEITAALIS